MNRPSPPTSYHAWVAVRIHAWHDTPACMHICCWSVMFALTMSSRCYSVMHLLDWPAAGLSEDINGLTGILQGPGQRATLQRTLGPMADLQALQATTCLPFPDHIFLHISILFLALRTIYGIWFFSSASSSSLTEMLRISFEICPSWSDRPFLDSFQQCGKFPDFAR